MGNKWRIITFWEGGSELSYSKRQIVGQRISNRMNKLTAISVPSIGVT